MKIKVATDFAAAPGPRAIVEGKNSGELFRTEVLFPKIVQALNTNDKLEVDLDGTAGYGTSFLEESFGGLIRENGLNLTQIRSVLKLISRDEPDLLDEISEYMTEAQEEASRK